MKLYELVGYDTSKGFSPFAWRAKLALEHKGIEYETVPLCFTEIEKALEFAGSKTVPVLVSEGDVITDSWDIACFLEENFPDQPSLFQSRSAAKLFDFQIAKSLLMPLFRTIVGDIFNVIDEKDHVYFRETREPRIGCTIEEAAETIEPSFSVFKENLWPYIEYLKLNEFIGGEVPTYQDYGLYGMFLWARMTSPKQLIGKDDSISSWLNRMDQLFDGLGANVTKIE